MFLFKKINWPILGHSVACGFWLPLGNQNLFSSLPGETNWVGPHRQGVYSLRPLVGLESREKESSSKYSFSQLPPCEVNSVWLWPWLKVTLLQSNDFMWDPLCHLKFRVSYDSGMGISGRMHYLLCPLCTILSMPCVSLWHLTYADFNIKGVILEQWVELSPS